MTLIVTSISNLGIIQASDSNLTGTGGTTAGPKVFPLGFTPAALSLAGTYSVGGVPMDAWMPQCIADYGVMPGATLEGFADHLARRLTNEITDAERNNGSLIHIAGYFSEGGASHPAMHFVRNLARIDPTSGDYDGVEHDFQVSEDFWGRDYLIQDTRDALARGGSQRYFNGTAAGRIAYFGVSQLLNEFFVQAWDDQAWKFKPPQTLEQQAVQLDLAIRAIGALFSSSDYAAPYIGGDVQTELVTPPADAVSI